MITPRFSLSQDENTVTITIRAPYCHLKELDVSVEQHVFIFFCQPYYLRLHFPGPIEENKHTKSSFNADNGEFTFQYEKVNDGEHFPDLEFVTKFLCSKIEVEDGGRKIDILGPESPIIKETSDSDNCNIQYGFAMRGGYNFKWLSSEFPDIFHIDPHKIKFEERQKLRLEMENTHFDKEHYLADLFDNDEIDELIHLDIPWKGFTKADLEFTPQELDFLKDLPNITYDLTEKQIKYCHNSLIEILFAYCYDYRTTYFDPTCESGWTISKLSSTLCCFDSFDNPKQAVVCAFRRSLIYPLYRKFNLCQQILKDLRLLLQFGEQFIIKCLINMYNIFLKGDRGYYVLNNLFIKDYIVYVMKWDKVLWNKTLQELNDVVIEKGDLGLNLLKLEKHAMPENDLSTTMANLHIQEQESSTDSDDETSSSSESESSNE